MNVSKVVIFCVLLLGAFLRFYQLDKTMVFIGDFAWFYISARDMLLTGHIPLVGIASSHPWIHQGAFWTYLLAPVLALGNFSPMWGGYLAGFIGILTIFVVWYVTKDMLGEKTALFAAIFFATSPLIVISSRLPYHTTPIPLFIALYIYSLFLWVRGNPYYFPLSLFFLVILYNFELATAVFASLVVSFFLWGIYKRTTWVKRLANKKIIAWSLLAILLPLTPMLMYDFSHGFPQTLRFIAWLGYRVLVIFGYPPLHPEIPSGTYSEMFLFLNKSVQMFYYGPNGIVGAILGVGSMFAVLWQIKKKKTYTFSLIGLSIGIPLFIILLGKIPSDAYLPMLFAQVSIAVGVFFSLLMHMLKKTMWVVVLLFTVLVSVNTLFLVNTNFGSTVSATLVKKIEVTKRIIFAANGREYTIIGTGAGSEFRSFTMPYEYIAWWLGDPVSEKADVKIEVYD